MIGWYYLHTNGDLIYKSECGDTAADIRESDFARAMWPLDNEDRETAWNIVVGGLALGATKARVLDLAEKWKCSDEDAQHYAERVGMRLYKDGADWCATKLDFVDLQASWAGFGDTPIEAMANLLTILKYSPGKMWGHSISGLLKTTE